MVKAPDNNVACCTNVILMRACVNEQFFFAVVAAVCCRSLFRLSKKEAQPKSNSRHFKAYSAKYSHPSLTRLSYVLSL